ncbi:MAG: hypothetical protein HYT87_17750 [Nitrospirae bacterium]|nr:hypothetical protein [Nitrospirota bacterium]
MRTIGYGVALIFMAVSSARAEEMMQYRKEMLVLDVEEGAISVTQVIFPAGAVDSLNFSVPRGARNVELQNGFSDPAPTALDDTRYFAKVEPGAMPLIVRYQVRTLGRSYRFEKPRDTDATDLKIFASHVRPAPKVTDARFDGLESLGQGLYYSFVVDASKRNEPLVIEFSRLPLNPIYLRLLTVAFGVSLAALFLKKRV